MIIKDENLIRKARLKATGANIHKLNGILGCYINWISIVNYWQDIDKGEFERTNKEFLKVENELKLFAGEL